jgi:hypothetical protein
MAKLPTQKKILREDVKGAPDWINSVIGPINSFMENVYTALNKNVTFSENIASFIKEITVTTPSGYPTMDDIEFMSELKTKALGVTVMQAYEKSTYAPAPGPVYAPWIEDNGSIILSQITGLEASKTYLIRLLVY